MSYVVENGKTTSYNLCENETVTSVLQNLALLLATKKGTIPMYREYGLSQEFLDKPYEIAKVLLLSEVTEAVEKFEPRATVINVDFEKSDITGKTSVRLEVEIAV